MWNCSLLGADTGVAVRAFCPPTFCSLTLLENLPRCWRRYCKGYSKEWPADSTQTVRNAPRFLKTFLLLKYVSHSIKERTALLKHYPTSALPCFSTTLLEHYTAKAWTGWQAPGAAEQGSIGQHSTAQHSTAQHGTAQHRTARHGTARHGTARHGTARHGTAQHSTAQHTAA